MKKPKTKTNLNDYKTYLFTSEDNGFQMLSHTIARNTFLSDGAKALFIYLNSHSKEAFYLSRENIAKYLNKSIETIKREMRELKKHGFLRLEKRPNENAYFYVLTQAPKMEDLPDFKETTIINAIKYGQMNYDDLDILERKGIITRESHLNIIDEIHRLAKTEWIKRQ